MRYHILNGDALQEKFPIEKIEGEIIVIREAFIDGPVSIIYDPSFWSLRKSYIKKVYDEPTEGYDGRVMSELNRIQSIDHGDEVYLWFEDDLFCQCNMWFAVDFISIHSRPRFYRIFPDEDVLHWKGFGFAGKDDLCRYFNQAISLTDPDILHMRKLWNAFVESDTAALQEMSELPCGGIRFQKEVIKAQIDRTPDESTHGRPQRTLAHLMKEGQTSFYNLYKKFSQQESIYGFGDTQVRNMMKDIEL